MKKLVKNWMGREGFEPPTVRCLQEAGITGAPLRAGRSTELS